MDNKLRKLRKGLVNAAKSLDGARVKVVKGFAEVQKQAREFDQKTGLAKDPNWLWGLPKKNSQEFDPDSYEIDGLILKKKKKKK